MFKNLTCFRVQPETIDREALEQALSDATLKPVGPQQLCSQGFLSPFGTEVMHHRIGDWVLVALGVQKRVLPPAALREELERRVAKEEERTGSPLGGRARKRLKDELLFEMLPKAFTVTKRTLAHLDLRHGFVCVDTASRKLAEEFCTALRVALGTFPAVPLAPQKCPRQVMTAWLHSAPGAPWAIGHEVEMRDPGDQGAVAKLQRQELEADEALGHVDAGKQVTRLELAYDGRLEFVVDEQLVVRKLRMTDVVMGQLDGEARDSAAELDARYALLGGELDRLLPALEEAFGLQAPQAASEFRLAA